MSDDWQNNDKIDIRTKIALKVLLVMFKILSPYRFGYQFQDILDDLTKAIGKL